MECRWWGTGRCLRLRWLHSHSLVWIPNIARSASWFGRSIRRRPVTRPRTPKRIHVVGRRRRYINLLLYDSTRKRNILPQRLPAHCLIPERLPFARYRIVVDVVLLPRRLILGLKPRRWSIAWGLIWDTHHSWTTRHPVTIGAKSVPILRDSTSGAHGDHHQYCDRTF